MPTLKVCYLNSTLSNSDWLIYDSTLASAQFLGHPLLAAFSLALLKWRLSGATQTGTCDCTSWIRGATKICHRFISSYAQKDVDGTNRIVERVEEMAKKRDISMAQVALAWILSKDGMLFYSREATELSMHSSCYSTNCGHQFFGEIEWLDQYVLVCSRNTNFLLMSS